MKSSLAGIFVIAAGIAVLPAGAPLVAQTPNSPRAPQEPPAQTTPQPPGQVIFSRSAGQSTSATPATQPPSQPPASAPATDAERQAVTFTAYDMDVHLQTAQRQIAVRAQLTVRNDGAVPLSSIPLQISSSLNWERIRADGRDVAFSVATLNSDADHTGQLHEADVPLAQPLPPGASLRLDVTYSGEIAPNPPLQPDADSPAPRSGWDDWDGIGADFTGLRGFGNVIWYPVSSVPVTLENGDRFFDEVGRQKLRLTGSGFRLSLTVEFPQGQAPTVAIVNGHPAELTVTNPGGSGLPGIATAELAPSTLGFETPSLFLAIRTQHAGPGMNLFTLPADDSAVASWTAAAQAVTPFLESWLGERPRTPLTLLDLPDPRDAPFEDGPFLATPIHAGLPDRLQGILVHALTHAFIQSPRAWLSEGVAYFMGALWIEKRDGRAEALASLGASRLALDLAEPSSPGESPGEPLDQAYTPVYYRTKAAYVLWMLRNLTGDQVLSAALRAYNPALDPTGPAGKPPAGPCVFDKLLEQAGNRSDLSWFFTDWVDADHGLPDLSIDHVYPTAADAGNWLVAIDLSNSGYAAAEVPLTVRSAITSVTRRVLIPARGKIVERILIQGKPTQVQLNDGAVPETEASVHITNLDTSSGSSSSSSQSQIH